jgi:cytochrome c oxidase subunit 2
MGSSLQFFPDQASTFAPQVDAVYFFLLAVTGFFSLLIFVLIAYFGLRYRRRKPNERPAPIKTHAGLEVTWIAIPFVIAMVVFFWGAKIFVNSRMPPANAEEVFVVGKQWMWKIQHAEGRREINELHVPRGRPIVLQMTSQDVIHDFAVPAFRVKQDVVPGRYTSEWFTATRDGEYHLFCDQYCGNEHADMIGTVVVMEPEEYQKWLSGSEGDVPARVAGERLFNAYGCAACHGSRAPTLAGLFGRQVPLAGTSQTVTADEDYLRESILYPSAKIVAGYPPIMPAYRGQLSEEQVMQVIAYIKSLSGAAATGAFTGPGGSTTQPTQVPPPIQDVPSFPNRQGP